MRPKQTIHPNWEFNSGAGVCPQTPLLDCQIQDATENPELLMDRRGFEDAPCHDASPSMDASPRG